MYTSISYIRKVAVAIVCSDKWDPDCDKRDSDPGNWEKVVECLKDPTTTTHGEETTTFQKLLLEMPGSERQ